MFAAIICAKTGKIKLDTKARIPGWLGELNLVLHRGGKAGACSDLGKFRINTALGECPVQEDQSRAVTHAFSQQLI